MTQALIFDAIRTPRGKGKADGALHSVKPVNLVAGLLTALQQRSDLDTRQVDDIVLGCVTPVGDQGADIAKTAALVADWDVSVAGVQVNRFCASGLEAVNLGAMKVRSGFEDLVVVGGVESMSRVPMGSDGGAWVLDPQTNMHSHFTPQGIGADLIATLEVSPAKMSMLSPCTPSRKRHGPDQTVPSRNPWFQCRTRTVSCCWSTTNSSVAIRPSKGWASSSPASK